MTIEGNTTTVELGTFKVTINALHEVGRADRFRLNWWLNGRRVTRNTSSHEAAVALAKDVLAERAKGQEPATAMEEKKREYLRICENQLGGVPLDVAVKFYLRNAVDAFTPCLVDTLVENHIAAKESRLGKRKASVRWVQTLRSRLRQFSSAFPKHLHEVTTEEIAQFLQSNGWGERTQFNVQQTIGILYRIARDQKALPSGETAFDQHMRSPYRAELPVREEKELLPPSSLKLLFKAAVETRPEMVSYLAVRAFAPLRAAEAGRLEWGTHVDLADGVIRCYSSVTKTARRRIIRIHPTLMEWLRPNAASEGKIVSFHEPRKLMTELWRTAGLSHWPRNALRTSVISYSMALHPEAAALADAAGNSETVIQTDYKQVRGASERTAREWFGIVPGVIYQGTAPEPVPAEGGGSGGESNERPCRNKCLLTAAASASSPTK